MTLPAGTRVGAFEIVAPLGAGGMGEVYRARDVRLQREVAIKVLPAEFANDPGRLKRFEKEARGASALNHPSIVTIYEVGAEGSSPFIAMELVPGKTLREVLLSGPLSTKKLMGIASQIAEGLAAAHEEGIVHRDLKPENVMITAGGMAKILDFGLAKLTRKALDTGEGAQATLSRTEPGGLLGTVAYMSPEQAAGQPADFRSDQFSMGSIVYEMATGKRAFQRENAVDTLSAILHEEPLPLSVVRPGAPVPLGWVIDRCLAKEPADRYASTRDLARDLVNLRDRSSSASFEGLMARPRPARSRLSVALPWVLAVLGTLTASAFAIRRSSERTRPPQPVRFLIPLPEQENLAESTKFVEWHNIAVSPDGSKVAFIGRRGRSRIWIRRLEEIEPEPLAGTEGASSPFWSPDGASLAFFADGKLRRVSLAGGLAQDLCPASRTLTTGAWGSSAMILFTEVRDGGRLQTVPAAGGTPVTLATTGEVKDNHFFLWPRFLPGGRRFLCLGCGGDGCHLLAGELSSGKLRTIAPFPSRFDLTNSGSLFYVDAGTLSMRPFDTAALRFTGGRISVAKGIPYFSGTGWAPFSASANGVLAYQARSGRETLQWLDRRGRRLGTVGEPGPSGGFRLSNDGQRLAVERYDPATGFPFLWVTDLSRNVTTRVTTNGSLEQHPVWSPDGSTLVFTDHLDLRVKRPDDKKEAEEILPGPAYVPMDWSLDGRRLLYLHENEKTHRSDLFQVSLVGERKPVLIRESVAGGGPDVAAAAAYSPDGNWVAFTSDESGQPEVYLAPVAGSRQWQVSTDGAAGQPIRWRRDGRELFYAASDHRLMAVGVDLTKEAPQLEVPVPLFETPSFGGYDVTGDGQRFLVGAREVLPITVALDWAGK
jgi:serine/threonine protein kinase